MQELPEFQGMPKIPRFFREIMITEKIDGTNAQIFIDDELNVFAGSKNRYVTPESDNYGFAKWVEEHKEELKALGPGRHFGEWWGQGIQRGYGLKEKRFSLFNVTRWKDNPDLPACCHVVPLLAVSGIPDAINISLVLDLLAAAGSQAAPGFMDPEGIVIFHTAANQCFKATIKNDEAHKGTS